MEHSRLSCLITDIPVPLSYIYHLKDMRKHLNLKYLYNVILTEKGYLNLTPCYTTVTDVGSLLTTPCYRT